MTDCLSNETLQAFQGGAIESEPKIESICNHLDRCEDCQARLEQLAPSSFEDQFRNILQSDDSVDMDSITEQLNAADELSSRIYENVAAPDGIGMDKKDRFRIESRLGDGHFFHCLVAYDLGYERRVVVKTPVANRIISDLHSSQFLDDALAASKLEHPNIVPTIDFGRWNDNRWFVCTELIQPQSLSNWLQSSAPSEQEVIKILSQICSALQYALREGVIHRHLDARNVFIDDHQHVWITDFGFVFDGRYQFGLHENHKQKSEYLPPEFFVDNENAIDLRSDVFSVGMLFKKCLEISTPDSGQNNLGVDRQEWDSIVRGCTRNSRNNRYRDINELIKSIRSLSPSLAQFGQIENGALS